MVTMFVLPWRTAPLLRCLLHRRSLRVQHCLASTASDESGAGNTCYIPRRAVLYVPGNDERKIAKIPNTLADCVVLDCEDGVAPSMKDAARSTIHATLQRGGSHFVGKDCSVRVNSVSSGLCAVDLTAVLKGEVLPRTLHLPKVETTVELDWFAQEVSRLLQGRPLSRQLRLVLFCESGRSLLSLPQLLAHAQLLSSSTPLLVDGVVFGSDDFCADIGMTRSKEARELLYARQHFVTVVRSHRLQAIDLVFIDYKDLEGLERQSEEGASFGFTGKQVIHPAQVEVVQRVFSPSAEKVAWAKELLEAYERHHTEGKGAFTFRGAMIDAPLVLQARNVLQVARQGQQGLQ